MLAAASAGVAMAKARVEITGATAADGRARGRIDVAFTVLARRADDVAEVEVTVAHDAGVLAYRQPPPDLVRGAASYGQHQQERDPGSSPGDVALIGPRIECPRARAYTARPWHPRP